ncbi:MAG: putative DNA modification/repair radical SAM protein [Defluviitaleaceae bacterium]|nr:putative DNA modification/repair radical SAM protein [Defluviitaleaceae bacterium]MCL2275552.1 putative DNA modification/repair radical SAM protein [Defluviitaleaceae bacterium]
MDFSQRLKTLTEGAKYDVACTSSGMNRKAKKGMVGSTEACGICHSFTADGRCISLLKMLINNYCEYDCQYCVNRRSSDIPRASMQPHEVADLTMQFYRRNYIEGLFLSSAVIKSPDYTMEMLIKTLALLRGDTYRFNGYIHVKAIPGADEALIQRLGTLADRMSINIELPSERSLTVLAPDKTKPAILAPMKYVKNKILQSKEETAKYRSAEAFVPAGQSTQLIVGATPEADSKIVHLAQGLYKGYGLRRVFYSAYIPVGNDTMLPRYESKDSYRSPTPAFDTGTGLIDKAYGPILMREHRLYQADWLLRFYGFTAGELFKTEEENLSLHLDPKCHWALRNLEQFPVEVNTADYRTLLRVPGIGQISAERIVKARRASKLDFTNLKKMGIVLKRARYFITCNGKMAEKINFRPESIELRLTDNHAVGPYSQLTLADAAYA